MGKSPSRPVSFAKPGSEADGGPGTYDDHKKFGDNVPSIRIAPEKRPERIETSPGPGHYDQ